MVGTRKWKEDITHSLGGRMHKASFRASPERSWTRDQGKKKRQRLGCRLHWCTNSNSIDYDTGTLGGLDTVKKGGRAKGGQHTIRKKVVNGVED